MRVAALTMAYNEPVWARVWSRYYAGQVGAENCYLIDHGSDDGSLAGLPVRVEQIARDHLDEEARAALVSARAAALLGRYDAVLHSDADELLVTGPGGGGLRAFAAAQVASVVTCIGLDLQHLPGEEARLEPERPITAQRRWLRFSAAMCKPALVRRPVRWSPGFHSGDAETVFADLYLVHLRYADLQLGLARLRRTRGQRFASAETNPHQRVSDEVFETMMRNIAELPRRTVPLSRFEDPVADWLERLREARATGGDWLSLAGDELWRVPEAWVGRF